MTLEEEEFDCLKLVWGEIRGGVGWTCFVDSLSGGRVLAGRGDIDGAVVTGICAVCEWVCEGGSRDFWEERADVLLEV